MTPGRELDALVATKVMGWKNIKHQLSNPYDDDSWEDWLGNPPLKPNDEGTRYEMRLGKCCPVCNHQDNKTTAIKVSYEQEKTIPPYSSDIAAAWQVVEKLFQLGFDLYLETFKDDEDNPQCRVSFQQIDNQDKGSGPIYADTAPHAICLAALKAVGVEI